MSIRSDYLAVISWSVCISKSQRISFVFIIIIIIIIPLEFFTSALADGLSLVLEWQQVPSSLQDSSQYSDRSQQYCS